MELKNILKIGFYWKIEGTPVDNMLVARSSDGEVLLERKKGFGEESKWSYKDFGEWLGTDLILDSSNKNPDLIILYSGKTKTRKTSPLLTISSNESCIWNLARGVYEGTVISNIPVMYNTEEYLEFED